MISDVFSNRCFAVDILLLRSQRVEILDPLGAFGVVKRSSWASGAISRSALLFENFICQLLIDENLLIEPSLFSLDDVFLLHLHNPLVGKTWLDDRFLEMLLSS